MIFTPLQKYKINKAQKRNIELRDSIAYERASYFGIIYQNDEQAKIDAAEKLSTLLKMDNKKVKNIAFEYKSTIKHLPYDTLTNENFDFWGGLKGKVATDFIEADFDFLICLDNEPNGAIRTVLANSKAKCRVGKFNKENEVTFEMFLVDKSNNYVQWVEELYQYLKQLS
jgi:hypothetical protein